jgi:hypothetical protein
MINKYITTLVLALIVSAGAFGQSEFNVQNLTPSALLPIGKWEIKSFNSNYTQTSSFDEKGTRVDNSGGILYNDDGSIGTEVDVLRNTFYTSVNQINYGLNSKINIGLEFWLNSSALSSSDDSRISSIMFSQTAHTRTAMSYVGARLKFVPFQSVSNFSVQSIFLIPVGGNLEGNQSIQPFVNWDNYTWMNQFFLDLPLNDRWSVFFNVDMVWGISRNKEVDAFRGNRLSIPFKGFLNYFATPRLTLLFQNEYNLILQAIGDSETREVSDAYYYQLGLSAKYQLLPSKLEGEVSYGYFLAGNNGQGAGNALSLGVRLLL